MSLLRPWIFCLCRRHDTPLLCSGLRYLNGSINDTGEKREFRKLYKSVYKEIFPESHILCPVQ